MKLDTYLTLCAEYYEIDKPNAPTSELDFYRSYVREAKGSILEPMCGTGRFMLPLVSEGYNMEGYDASLQMLNYLYKKADNLNLQINAWEQFAETALSDKSYELIFIPSGSFGLITEEENIKTALTCFYHQLTKGGKLVFEVESSLCNAQNLGVWQGDIRYRNNSDYIMLSTLNLPIKNNISKVICKYELVESNTITQTEIETIKIRLYSHDGIKSLLNTIGFSDVSLIKTHHRTDLAHEQDECFICECIK